MGIHSSWAKDPFIGHTMINARSETIARKLAFRSAFKKKRCLVIADGFSEWRAEGKKKFPTIVIL
jgi:putative SOS response-associated peptidase YedK